MTDNEFEISDEDLQKLFSWISSKEFEDFMTSLRSKNFINPIDEEPIKIRMPNPVIMYVNSFGDIRIQENDNE